MDISGQVSKGSLAVNSAAREKGGLDRAAGNNEAVISRGKASSRRDQRMMGCLPSHGEEGFPEVRTAKRQ